MLFKALLKLLSPASADITVWTQPVVAGLLQPDKKKDRTTPFLPCAFSHMAPKYLVTLPAEPWTAISSSNWVSNFCLLGWFGQKLQKIIEPNSGRLKEWSASTRSIQHINNTISISKRPHTQGRLSLTTHLFHCRRKQLDHVCSGQCS